LPATSESNGQLITWHPGSSSSVPCNAILVAGSGKFLDSSNKKYKNQYHLARPKLELFEPKYSVQIVTANCQTTRF